MHGAARLRFDAIIFDLGSTLIHFQGDWHSIRARSNDRLVDALLAYGLRLPREIFLEKWQSQLSAYQTDREQDLIERSASYVLRAVLAELGYPDVTEQMLRESLAAMYTVTQRCWKAETDAAATLSALRSRGYRLGVLSNAADDDDVQRLIDQAELRPYLDFVLSSSNLGFRKPHPRTFLAGLNHWGLPPERAAMVGDNLRADILGANQLGMYSIWITRRIPVEGPVDPDESITPNATVGALGELLMLMDGLAGQ